MTTENPYPWADGMDCAVTVCDTGGTILYMNDKARTTFARHGDMVGKNGCLGNDACLVKSGRAKSSAACSPTGARMSIRSRKTASAK